MKNKNMSHPETSRPFDSPQKTDHKHTNHQQCSPQAFKSRVADQPIALGWHFRLRPSSTYSHHFYFTDNPDTQKLNYKLHSCDRYIDKYYVVKRKDNGDSSIKEDYWIKHRYTSHEDYWILSIINVVKTLHSDSDKNEKLSYLEICAVLDRAGYQVNGPDAFQCIVELVSDRQYFIRDDVEIYLAFTAMPDGRYLKHGSFSFQANILTDETELNTRAKVIVSELGAVHGKSAIMEYLRQFNSEYAALFTNTTDLSKYYSQVNQFDSLQGLHESDSTNSNDQSVSEYEDFYNKHHREIIVSDELVEKMRPKILNLLDKVKCEQVRTHENYKKDLLKCDLTLKTRENMTMDQKVMMEEMEALLKQESTL